MKKNFLLVFILFLFSCEPDDICLSTIADTPKMIIIFYDHSSGQKKEVQNLQIKGSENSNVYFEKTTDSIALPLKNLEKITGYSLTNNYSDNVNQLLNTDDILINYEYNYVFVSRACGYVSNFPNFKISRKALIAARNSRRAICIPMQTCMPVPKLYSLASLPKITLSGWS